jgi:predicted transcriptional regulator YdeE
MSLNEEGQIVLWPETHYVCVEAEGPFQQTAPQSWQRMHAHVPALRERYAITGFMSLYKMNPMVYCAGVSLAEEPGTLPKGLKYMKFSGGAYIRFVLNGSYAQLPQASGRVWQIVGERKIAVRDGFAIENYVNNPALAPEAELITEILIPTFD